MVTLILLSSSPHSFVSLAALKTHQCGHLIEQIILKLPSNHSAEPRLAIFCVLLATLYLPPMNQHLLIHSDYRIIAFAALFSTISVSFVTQYSVMISLTLHSLLIKNSPVPGWLYSKSINNLSRFAKGWFCFLHFWNYLF
jgi:hypothetical protein